MKHPRTTICGVISALALVLFAVCFCIMIYDLAYAYSPLRHRGLLTATIVALAIHTLAHLAGMWHAADARSVEPVEK